MAGIGLDAAVVAATREQLKRRLGWVAYAAAGVTRLALPPRDFTVRLDDAEPLRRRARCVVVANAGLLPGGFTLLPGARLDDGLLDVGILAPSGTWGWVRVAGRVLARGRRPARPPGPHAGVLPGAPDPGQRGHRPAAAGRRRDHRTRPGAHRLGMPRRPHRAAAGIGVVECRVPCAAGRGPCRGRTWCCQAAVSTPAARSRAAFAPRARRTRGPLDAWLRLPVGARPERVAEGRPRPGRRTWRCPPGPGATGPGGP